MSAVTSDWEAFLPSLAHNVAINRSTYYSPFFLLFGRQPCLPGDMEKPFTSSESLPHELFRHLQAAHQWVMRNNEAARERYKGYYDRRKKQTKFTIGDQVLVTLKCKTRSSIVHGAGYSQWPRFPTNRTSNSSRTTATN